MTRHHAEEDPTLPAADQRQARTLSSHHTDGWALARFYGSENACRKAIPAFIHDYNRHRPHTATGGRPPITRLTSLPGQYN